MLPPGDTMLEMMADRGWSEHDMAARAGMEPSRVPEIAAGAQLSDTEAAGLGRAFGCTARVWSDRNARYDDWRFSSSQVDIP